MHNASFIFATIEPLADVMLTVCCYKKLYLTTIILLRMSVVHQTSLIAVCVGPRRGIALVIAVLRVQSARSHIIIMQCRRFQLKHDFILNNGRRNIMMY